MSKTATVPYCTVKGFRRALDLLGKPPAPTVVDRQVLIDRGLSPHSVYPVLGALRYLGIVAADGRLTPTAAAFLAPDDIAGRRAAVERAYADVLADVPFPVEDREVVDQILIVKHGCAPGVAAFCSTLFLWLAAEAGMPVAVPGQARRGRPPAHLAQLSDAARARLDPGGTPADGPAAPDKPAGYAST